MTTTILLPDFSERDALRRVGLTSRALPSLQAQGFPLPVLIGKRRRYYSAEVDAWLATQIATRTNRTSALKG